MVTLLGLDGRLIHMVRLMAISRDLLHFQSYRLADGGME